MVPREAHILGTGAMTPFRGNHDTTSLLVVFIIDLYAELRQLGILTVAGSSFIGLAKNSVRVCIPKEYGILINVIREIEKIN